ncbi:MAG: ATP-dependent Clp protease adaptor ClpS [bacterium]
MAPVLDKPAISDGSIDLDDAAWQVVMFNDNHNDYCYVVRTVMRIFSYGETLAEKVTREAHEKGKCIASVEDRELAFQHKDALLASGIQAQVEQL